MAKDIKMPGGTTASKKGILSSLKKKADALESVLPEDEISAADDPLQAMRESLKDETDDQDPVRKLRKGGTGKTGGRSIVSQPEHSGTEGSLPERISIPRREPDRPVPPPASAEQEPEEIHPLAARDPKPQEKPSLFTSLAEISEQGSSHHKDRSTPSLRNIRRQALEDYDEPETETPKKGPGSSIEPPRPGVPPVKKRRPLPEPAHRIPASVQPRTGLGDKEVFLREDKAEEKFIPLSEISKTPPFMPYGGTPGSGDLRGEALQDFEENPKEDEPPSPSGRIREFSRRMSPSRKRLLGGFIAAVLLLIIAAGVFLIVRDLQVIIATSGRPTPAYPYPVQVTFPGELTFDLHPGEIKEGVWSPEGAEWLNGTQICPWIAIPWSRKTETAVLKLQEDDPITLNMSNSDRQIFYVRSVEWIDILDEQAHEYDDLASCLRVFVIQKDSSSRLVVTASP